MSPSLQPGGRPSVVLFDMDGLLLDTEGAYTVAQQRILDRFGRKFTWELKAKMMGRQALDAARVLCEDLQLTPEEITPEQFLVERDALLQEAFADAPLMPGAERLVRHLAACGVPMAVATGSHAAAFKLKTSKHGELFSLFHHVVTGDMVARAKPNPEIFIKAAAGFTDPPAPPAAPGAVLVFEDAPNGVEAALAGGMRVVMAPYPGLPQEHVAGCGATQVLPSLEAFNPEEWGLPPFPAATATAAAAPS
ncbi:hypothetical protein HXX76_010843 [Chlamydomonas incerta]|uniref:Uncharacterized protein n=1 Tax=Chlamydomonas incerta TaxID=51695 RepID=A0A835VVN4_CHLIN|nr:hypothetical protein HXX76_010843 [Chlamydomonas incerta]|eukprot:KAG2429610.1 hypothetical protein HXX76_010843 [Chlamydomonas incerta]